MNERRRIDYFAEKHPRLLAELEGCFAEGERLTGLVRARLAQIEN